MSIWDFGLLRKKKRLDQNSLAINTTCTRSNTGSYQDIELLIAIDAPFSALLYFL